MNRFRQKVTLTLEEYQAICMLQDADMMTSFMCLYLKDTIWAWWDVTHLYTLKMLNIPSNPPNHPLYEIDVTNSNEPCSEYVLYLYLLSVHIQTVVDMKGCKTSFGIHLLIPGYCSCLQGGMHQSDRCYLFKGSTVETNNIQNVLCSAIHF